MHLALNLSISTTTQCATQQALQAQLCRVRLHLAEEGGAALLAADRLLLQVASECARNLPADAGTWDFSRLLVGGEPGRREVVHVVA